MYFTNSEPINGKSKFRYWDFLVQEKYFENGNINLSKILDFETDQKDFFKDLKEDESYRDYLYFEMQKINTDVQNVIKTFSQILQIGKSKISYAGLKDKRGVTSQRMCIYKPNIDLLKKFDWKMVKIHSFRWSDERIGIGDLESNCFTIIIRQIDLDKDLDKIMTDFKNQIKNGITNKFGSQRFGGIRNITHRVGKLIINGKIEEAIMLYLGETNDKEFEDIKKARALIRENKFKEALKAFPRKGFRYERAILDRLNKDPNDFVNAWLQLPKTITFLFSHAYQSYLFNKYIDLRIKMFGKDALEPQEGDVLDEEGFVLGPLFGYDFEFADGKIGDLEKQILKEDNITLEEFKVKYFPQMSVAGARRRIKLMVEDFKYLEKGKDEFSENKQYVKISFCLPKSSYATIVLDELMKPFS